MHIIQNCMDTDLSSENKRKYIKEKQSFQKLNILKSFDINYKAILNKRKKQFVYRYFDSHQLMDFG